MAWQITFRGQSLLTSVEGTYDFTPGSMNRQWSFVRLPRALGEFAKDLGRNGASHTLVARFHNVALAGLASVFSRISGFQTPVAGALVVPDFGAYGNCVIESVEHRAQTPTVHNIALNGNNLSETRSCLLEFTIKFRQLR